MPVYFVAPVIGGPVRIGYSEAPKHRLAGLLAWSPYELQILATLDGGFLLEAWFLHRFRAHKHRGDWHKPEFPVIEAAHLIATTGAYPGAPVGDDRYIRLPRLSIDTVALADYFGLTEATFAAGLGMLPQSFGNWRHGSFGDAAAGTVLSLAHQMGVLLTIEGFEIFRRPRKQKPAPDVEPPREASAA